ncbi:MAG: O-antigen ligase family protein [Bacillota bacterium]|nr:O-antigen ligase family protein [Bacillota bacterium]
MLNEVQMFYFKLREKIPFLFDSSVFRFVYIALLFLDSVFYAKIVTDFLYFAIFGWGVAITFFNYIFNGKVIKIKYIGWISAFLISTVVTMFININSNFWPNFVMLLHISVCFIVFYGMHVESDKQKIKKEIYYIAKFIVIASSVIAAIGFVLLIIFEKQIIVQGSKCIIYENRFTGIYTNPNLLAFSAVVAIFMCHILIQKSFLQDIGKKMPHKALLITCVVLNVLSLFLSDSNDSTVFLAIYIVLFMIYKLFFEQKKASEENNQDANKSSFQILKKCGIVFLATVVISVGCFTARFISQNGMMEVMDFAKAIHITIPGAQNNKEITFEHQNTNIDSGRIVLLSQSTILISEDPIFGIGKGNLVEYGNRYIKGGLHFDDLHNGFLTILVCSGLVGFTIFIIFCLYIGRRMLLCLFRSRKFISNYSIFPCFIMFIISYCFYGLFEKTVLLDITFMVMIFWLIIGYAFVYTKEIENSRRYHMLKRYRIIEKEQKEKAKQL